MRNADLKFKVQTIVDILDDWLDAIHNETDPAEDFKTDPTLKGVPDMQYPYQAGVWKARAGMNADKLERLQSWLLNEFKTLDVQSRLPKV